MTSRNPTNSNHPGGATLLRKGWLKANIWLIARRLSQISILFVFLLGPLYDFWLVKGNLNYSLTLDVLPLTDPFVLLQSLFAGHPVESTAITGAIIVVLFYMLVGGRTYCSWVCPVNIVTDSAQWLRDQFKLSGASTLSRNTRYWIVISTLILSFITGSIAWEMINPISMLHRGLIFGMGLAWIVVLAVFNLDLLVVRRGWCSHLCPVGVFYSLIGTKSLIRIRADARDKCDDCMDCFKVCPEQQVIRPALKGMNKNIGPVITSSNCTNCGRCIDVCDKDVFNFGLRFNNTAQDHIDSHDNNKNNSLNTMNKHNNSSEVEAL